MFKINLRETLKINKNSLYLMLAIYLISLAYILPTILSEVPYGTDVFLHLFYTNIMSKVASLNDFYMACIENNYFNYKYPFGLWLFGSISMKITGLSLESLPLILPYGYFTVLIFLYLSLIHI